MSSIKFRNQPALCRKWGKENASTPRRVSTPGLDRNIRQRLLGGFWTCVHQLQDLDLLVITLPCWCSLKTNSGAAHQMFFLVKYSHSLSLYHLHYTRVCINYMLWYVYAHDHAWMMNRSATLQHCHWTSGLLARPFLRSAAKNQLQHQCGRS